MRSKIIRKPSHDERRAWKDASTNEERATVLCPFVRCGDEHDVSDHSNCQTTQHKDTTPLETVTGPACNENSEEATHVWRHGQELCNDIVEAKSADDGRQEEAIAVDRGDEQEEVEGHQDGVPVEESPTGSFPTEVLVFGVRIGCAMRISS